VAKPVARKFNVGETIVREWRKEEAAIKYLHRKKCAMRYRRCFWPELEKGTCRVGSFQEIERK
jgi:hypothetical protein